MRVFLSRYRGYALCPDCKGARLRKEALYVRVGGKNLAEIVRMNIAEAHEFFGALALSPEETAIADKILVEIRQRLKFLNDVGLDYLTLDRLSATLSGGEAQRIQLATSLLPQERTIPGCTAPLASRSTSWWWMQETAEPVCTRSSN